MQKSLEIRRGELTALHVRGSTIDLEVGSDFDLIRNCDGIDSIFDFEIGRIGIKGFERESWLFKAMLTLSSLVRGDPIVECDDVPSLSSKEIASIVRNLRIDFFDHVPRIEEIEQGEQTRITIDIVRRYVDILAQNGFVFPTVSKPQLSVKAQFDNIGLVHDLVMRDPRLSGNPDWCTPTDRSGRIVRTVDLRLTYAARLSALPGCNSYLEVGSGSGFVTHYLSAMGKQALGSELSEYRVEGAKLLGRAKGTKAEFIQADATRLPFDDEAFDVVHTCFVLEQCNEVLREAVGECIRVARKYCVFLEPSTQFFPTLPSLVHIPVHGQPMDFASVFSEFPNRVRVERPEFSHMYNTGCVFVLSKLQKKSAIFDLEI